MKAPKIVLETAVEAVKRLGFKPGDVLESKFWDGVPLRIDRLNTTHICVTRMHEVVPGDWRPGLSHMMKYLPADVAKRGLP
jgi:hypothetical protein